MTNRRMLELALAGLVSERDRIESEIRDLSRQLGRRTVKASDEADDAPAQSKRAARKRRRRKMTTAQKQAISEKMKANWAKRKRTAKRTTKQAA